MSRAINPAQPCPATTRCFLQLTRRALAPGAPRTGGGFIATGGGIPPVEHQHHQPFSRHPSAYGESLGGGGDAALELARRLGRDPQPNPYAPGMGAYSSSPFATNPDVYATPTARHLTSRLEASPYGGAEAGLYSLSQASLSQVS
jgi:hypothetical protein